MTFAEIFEQGRQAHKAGGYRSYGGGFRSGSHEERVWEAGWDVGCVDNNIAQGCNPADHMSPYSRLFGEF